MIPTTEWLFSVFICGRQPQKVKLLTSQIVELTMDEFWFQTDPSLPVLAPGDKEKLAAKKTDEKGTITYLQQQIDSCEALAKRLSVKPMEIKNK